MLLNRSSKNGNDAPSFGRHFDQWRASCPVEWRNLIRHKFVLSLADGSLPRKRFIHYLRQNYIFLIHFARSWGHATSKGSDISEIRVATAMMHEVVNKKMQMHIEMCNEEGIGEKELFETTESSVTSAYLSHFENVVDAGDFVDMMAVLSPSVLGYAEIGAYLATITTASDYGRWIDIYASKNNQALYKEIGVVIDNAIILRLKGNAMTTSRWQELCKRFRITAELEADFLQMALSG